MKLITELTESVNYIFEEDEKSGKKNYFIDITKNIIKRIKHMENLDTLKVLLLT